MAEAQSDSSDEEPTIAEDIVVTKYKLAGEMANRVLQCLLKEATAGKPVLSLCERGDALIAEETGKVFKKEKEMKKGVAFPTCISINNCVCHFSPLRTDPEVVLVDGDVVKIDLGVHIDGFIAAVAHTVVVGMSPEMKVEGRKADCIMAAYLASELALRLVKPGEENSTVTDAIQRVAESFQCKPVEGMLSHQLTRHVIDGEKSIIQNPTELQRKEHKTCTFAVHEVYAVDVLVSSGDGRSRQLDARTTVFKKTEGQYSLKMKASRVFYSEVANKFTTLPFTLRAFDDERKARMGVVECSKHGLMEPFNVLYEKDGEFVAQFKFTVLLMPNGPMRITQGPFNSNEVLSQYGVEDEELKSLLATSANKKAQKKKKKKKAAKAADAAAADAAAADVAATTEAANDADVVHADDS
ncbi:proliferation-associated protein 2G4-like [Corticium candelabrum]|uniref:proliferation-associated protein 2G4-like n=1 Tax=Corticium candelabrum TaxID=121492 RepID=UPI002E25A389|nr:proliferation-associated protein 2G4-like [Corticium candelabrum]